MINVKELRIGNLVNFRGGHYRVVEIRLMPELSPSGYWVTLDGYDNPVHIIELNGIEVSEEWLLDNGFRIYLKSDYVKVDLTLYLLVGFNFVYEEGSGDIKMYDNWISYDKQYIHQLQNIVLDLTGKEL